MPASFAFNDIPEEIHEPSRSESASPLSRLFFSWVGPLIYVASNGELPLGLVDPLPHDMKVLPGTKCAERAYEAELQKSQSWDAHIGTVVSYKNKQGILKSLGLKHRSNKASVLCAEVEWSSNGTELDPLCLVQSVPVRKLQLVDAPSVKYPRVPNLLGILFRIHRSNVIMSVLSQAIGCLALSLAPVILSAFVGYLESPLATWNKGLLITACFFGISLCGAVSIEHSLAYTIRIGLSFRAYLMSFVLKKSLTVSPYEIAHPDVSLGRIITIMSADLQLLFLSTLGIVHASASITQTLMACLLLQWYTNWWIALATIGVLFLVTLFQANLSRLQYNALVRLSACTDRRVKAVNEVLMGARIIKYMGWEENFVRKISKLRNNELAERGTTQNLLSFIIASSFLAFSLVYVCVFGLLVLHGVSLTPTLVFPLMSCINLFEGPTAMAPTSVKFALTAMVSAQRINRFLYCEDVTQGQIKSLTEEEAEEVGALFVNADVAAPEAVEEGGEILVKPKTLLSNVELAVPQGKLTVVLGQTGSGKSVLLEALAGGAVVTEGTLYVRPNRTAFAPQQPWLMMGSVRDNIIFFDQVNEQRLQWAMRVSQLGPDLEILADGEYTMIGERGVSLSGGQRARVGLARAVYADKDLYILDDPLAAVDAHVGQQMIEDCILSALSGKTRVVATHQESLALAASHIVVMEDGHIAFQGSQAEWKEWLKLQGNDEMFQGDPEAEKDHTKQSEEDTNVQVKAKHVVSDEVESGMTEEERAVGDVPRSTYLWYVRSAGPLAWSLFIITFVALSEGVMVGKNLWLAEWSVHRFPKLSDVSYLYIYFGILGTACLVQLFRPMMIFSLTRKAANSLHTKMFQSVTTAPSSFFDTTPLGRVISRFSNDMNNCDGVLPENLTEYVRNGLTTLSTIGLLVASQPLMFIVLIPLLVVYSQMQRLYTACMRETRRIENLNRSPVFTLLSESLDGVSTIRVYQKVKEVVCAGLVRIDALTSSSFLNYYANRWLSLRITFLAGSFVSLVALLSVIAKMTGIGGSNFTLISLAVTQSNELNFFLLMMLRFAAEVESSMTSIERIEHYTNKIEQEDLSGYSVERPNPLPRLALAKHVRHLLPLDFSTHGTRSPATLGIEFRNVSLRYRVGLPLVLRDVSFRVAPGQKVALVGRTGSGKSTTLLALMRAIDPAEGSVLVGGVDARAFALPHLRSLFAMIPQEPTLFDGTVRSNLDPFNEHRDANILTAVERVGMSSRVMAEGGLDANVEAGGTNFSVGQRQLLCMGRALLSDGTGFILMDEATANVDRETDKMIQTALREAFTDRTVITIAHRLETVLDNDVIVVMSHGEVVEQGAPPMLIQSPNGALRSMIAAAGPEQERRLLDIVHGDRVVGAASPPPEGAIRKSPVITPSREPRRSMRRSWNDFDDPSAWIMDARRPNASQYTTPIMRPTDF